MALLSIDVSGAICLRLTGGAENAVLNSLRRWPHWQRVDVERSPDDSSVCLAVTLMTDSTNEPALRNILKHGFGMTFPLEGGPSEGRVLVAQPEVRRGRGGRSRG